VRLIWVLRELPMGAPLAEQIPALIKGFLKAMKPRGGIADLTWALLHLAAQLMLSIDHLANAREDVGVVHKTQPKRDLRWSKPRAAKTGITDDHGLLSSGNDLVDDPSTGSGPIGCYRA
jgi:hypothetical protein